MGKRGSRVEDKQTLNEYVYGNLREQILTGYLRRGEPLPSLSQLCETYHVGIRTARDVLRRLSQEDLIRTEERRPSVVIYRRPEEEGNQVEISAVLARRVEIGEIYETMGHIMPELFVFSVQVCGREAALEYLKGMKKDGGSALEVRWKTASTALHRLLDASCNLLFRDMFSSLKICARVPFFLECSEAASLSRAYRDYGNPVWIAEAVETGNPEEIRRRFRTMYRALADGVEEYLASLAAMADGTGCGAPEEKRCFSWNAKLGRDHYYLQIGRSLIDRIGTGFYRDGSFLPSEAALAAEYGVSASTIRKALAMLNRLGFCRTYNVKGTQVTLFNDEATFYALKNRVHKRETLLYLSGLQFMTLAAGPAAKLAFSGISGTELLRLKEKMEQPLSIPLDVLIRCVIRYLPLEPYRVILQEVSDILHWGYYYSFYEGGARSANELNNRALNAFALLEEGRRDAFAGELSGCFGHALEMVRDAMVEFGLLEAANLVTPKPQ